MAERTIFVDGYNVIRNTPGLAQAEATSLESGREALLALLATRYRHTQWRVVVVFDGDKRAESVQRFPGLEHGTVVFASAYESADAVILRMATIARSAGVEVTVISDDLEVRDGARQFGATTAHVADLERSANRPPRLLRKRFNRQIAAQRQLADATDDDAEAPPRRDKGNPRRAPRKRGQRRTDQPW